MTAPQPATALDAIRHEIDAIDGQILRLLTQRFAATEKVKATKKQDGSIASSPFRPAREAMMMRRLLGEADGSLSPDLLVRFWRVILSASIQSQAPVTLHIDAALGHDLGTRILVAQHFCAMTVELHASPARALEALTTAQGDLALVAPSSDWAAGYRASDEAAGVIGTLPVLLNGNTPQLLVFGHADPQPSGDDETLVLLEPEAPRIPAAIWEARSGISTLVGLPGFLEQGDPLLRDVLLRSPAARIAGRYPRPIKPFVKVQP